MRKILSAISLLLCLSFLFPALPITAEESKAPEMGSFEEIIASYYDPDGRPMSCAHRAITYIGNPIPENSLVAIQDAIDHKVDIVELDIARTKDGVYVLCHDSSIKRTTTYTGSLNVSDMTYAEICKYPLLQYTGGSRDVYRDENGNTLVMPTFEDALKLCHGKIMINLDKFTSQWSRRMELYELVRKHDCLDLVMFKGGYDAGKILGWHKEIKAKYGADAQMPNFATMNSNRDAATWAKEIKAHHDAKTAFAVEAGFSDFTQPQSDPVVIAKIKKYARVFTNVLYESIGGTHSAQHKENSTGWAEVISLGYNIVQTNNAADLVNYIYANYSKPTKDIGEGIDLLYFSGYKHTGINYTIVINAPSVRMYDGDYISFKNVDFRSCETRTLIAEITGAAGKGELVVRKGSETGEVIAKFELSKLGERAVNVTTELLIDNVGLCDIYVCAENMGDGFVSASRLICADPQEGEITRTEVPSFFTRPGVAPSLPEKISLINEYGFAYEFEVVWSPIPEACYAEAPARFTVPGIVKETCRRVSASVTVLDLDMAGAAIWFDSLGEMVLSESGEVLEWYDSVNSVVAKAQSKSAPTYKDGSVCFDGLGDSMSYDHSLSDKSDISIVVNANTDKKSTDYMSNFKINNSARYSLIHYPESGSWGSVYFSAFNDGIVCRFGSGENNNRGIYYTGVSLYGWKTVSAIKDGASEKLFLGSKAIYDRALDKSAIHQMGTPGETVTATQGYAYIGLGIQSSTNYYYSGSVRDIVIFERTLSKEELKAIDDYFKAKNDNSLKDHSSAIAAEFESFLLNNKDDIHSFEYSCDDTSHTAVCKKCGYSFTEEHSCVYAEKDGEYHVKSCAVCSFEREEPHSFSVSDQTCKCSACNAEAQLDKQPGGAMVIYVAVALALAGLAVTAFVVIIKKKRSGK
jgi:glycerophosphoryl diester phosphodiesterase